MVVNKSHIPNINYYNQEVKELTYNDFFLSWINITDIYRPINTSTLSWLLLNTTSDYLRIAISWWPSSGKTTVLNPLNNKYDNVYVFPEIATQLINYLKKKHNLALDDTSWASKLFSDEENAKNFEYVTLLIRKMQKEYADMIGSGIFVSDRAVVEGYHFMNISNVKIDIKVENDISKTKEDIIFLFERRKFRYHEDWTRYEGQENAILQHEDFKKIIPEKWWYTEWENYFLIPTYVSDQWLVSDNDYEIAWKERLNFIEKICKKL